MQKLGPLLQFLGCRDSQWGVSVLVVTDAADAEPSLSFNAAALPITRTSIAVPGQPCTAWRFDFAVPQTAGRQSIEGQINGQSFGFSVPAMDSMPSMAYASCNGFSDLRALKKMTEPHALWARLGRLHTLQDRVDNQAYGPFDLLLLGGDQVYSDATWALVPELVEWTGMDWYTRTMYQFPTTTHRMIGCRNFLTLQPDAPGAADDPGGSGRYWANWWDEGEPHPYTKVIHPVS